MMSRKIRFIIAIVTCSLVGILLFQGYWLYNSYGLSSQQFEKEVLEVVKQLERNRALTEMEQMGLFGDSSMRNDRERLSSIVDVLMLSQRLPEPMKREDSASKKKTVFGSTMVFSLTDTITGANHVMLDSAMKIRKHLADPMNGSHIGQVEQSITIDPIHRYSQSELAAFADPLAHELDSLLRSVGIGADFAFELRNFNRVGTTYISDSTWFANKLHQLEEARIGVTKPYLLTLAIDNDMAYILRNMLWVLLASGAIIGVTAWAFMYMLRTIFQQKRLSEIKNDFINNMTHEFKTPIATVSLAVEAMLRFDVMNKPERAKEYLDICQHELKRISVMVEKVLKMAAFEQRDVKLSPQKTDIGKLVNGVVDNMRPLLEKKAAKLSVKPLDEQVEAEVDRDHFANVVYNLIDNSLKYADKTPQIDVVYEATQDGKFRLSVTDNGIGIPSAYHERVFENFFRVPTGNVHNAKGFGLGLGYVITIIKKHQGTIDVRSEVGVGSTFTILVPINQRL